jgi:predicted nucleic acid-binding protein
MIEFLVDTDWAADYLKGKEDTVQLLSPLIGESRLGMSIISYAELWEGVLGSRRQEVYRSALADLVAGVPVLGLDRGTAEVFGGMRADLRRQGRLIPDLDLLIATTALRHDLTVISRDEHFRRLPGLKLYGG